MHLSTKEGLSTNRVTSITQDSLGLMWFATINGLNAYDGYKMKHHKAQIDEKGSLKENYIRTILLDKLGDLWLGTENGLHAHDKLRDTFAVYLLPVLGDEPKDMSINAFYEDKAGDLYVGTYNGVFSFDKKRKEWITLAKYQNKILGIGSQQTFLEDKQGNLWIGCTEGLFYYKRKEKVWKLFPINSSETVNSRPVVSAIVEEKEGFLLVGTRDRLYRLEIATGKFSVFQLPEQAENTIELNINGVGGITNLLKDTKGRIWIGIYRKGLLIWDTQKNRFHHYQKEENNPRSLSDNMVNSIFEDRAGNIWIGTNNGVNYLPRNNSVFQNFQSKKNDTNGLNSNGVGIFVERKDSTIWIGADNGGLHLFDPKTLSFKSSRNSGGIFEILGGLSVRTLVEDEEGQLWAGALGQGLYRLNAQSMKEGQLIKKHYSIYRIFEDSQNYLWVAAKDWGLSRYNKNENTFVNFQYNEQEEVTIGAGSVFHFCETKDSIVWMAKEDGLIAYHLAEDRFYNYLKEEASAYSTLNAINVLFLDEDNQWIWMGAKNGLYCFDYQKKIYIEYWHEKHGLANNNITGITSDHRGNLWITNGAQLSKFNKTTKTFTNYFPRDGLQGRDFKPKSIFTVSSGHIYIGGENGFNIFHPR